MKGNCFLLLCISAVSSEYEISRERREIWTFKQKKLVIMDSEISQLIDTCILKNELSKQV